MNTTIKQVQNVRPYRVPRVHPEPVEIEAVSLDAFDLEDIREYLHRQDNHVPDAVPKYEHGGRAITSLVITADELCRIETLALCGQVQHAREEALRLISDHIGRPL